jgi:hypothetical protein
MTSRDFLAARYAAGVSGPDHQSERLVGAVVPILGSVVVAVAAFVGVVLTNRRSDKREVSKWRRETIVKLSSDALA